MTGRGAGERGIDSSFNNGRHSDRDTLEANTLHDERYSDAAEVWPYGGGSL